MEKSEGEQRSKESASNDSNKVDEELSKLLDSKRSLDAGLGMDAG